WTCRTPFRWGRPQARWRNRARCPRRPRLSTGLPLAGCLHRPIRHRRPQCDQVRRSGLRSIPGVIEGLARTPGAEIAARRGSLTPICRRPEPVQDQPEFHLRRDNSRRKPIRRQRPLLQHSPARKLLPETGVELALLYQIAIISEIPQLLIWAGRGRASRTTSRFLSSL